MSAILTWLLGLVVGGAAIFAAALVLTLVLMFLVSPDCEEAREAVVVWLVIGGGIAGLVIGPWIAGNMILEAIRG